MSPAEYVIHIFGGVRKCAREINRSPSSVSKWQAPKERRGCGGNIPSGAQRIILDRAKKLGLDLTADDLINGRKVKKK